MMDLSMHLTQISWITWRKVPGGFVSLSCKSSDTFSKDLHLLYTQKRRSVRLCAYYI